jgi:transposase
MGQRDVRRLLIVGAMSVISAQSRRKTPGGDQWLKRILEKRPRMVVAVAFPW